MSNKDFKERLRSCNSMREIFDATNSFYDTDAKLGAIAKGILIVNIDKIISTAALKPKIKK